MSMKEWTLQKGKSKQAKAKLPFSVSLLSFPVEVAGALIRGGVPTSKEPNEKLIFPLQIQHKIPKGRGTPVWDFSQSDHLGWKTVSDHKANTGINQSQEGI